MLIEFLLIENISLSTISALSESLYGIVENMSLHLNLRLALFQVINRSNTSVTSVTQGQFCSIDATQDHEIACNTAQFDRSILRSVQPFFTTSTVALFVDQISFQPVANWHRSSPTDDPRRPNGCQNSLKTYGQ